MYQINIRRAANFEKITAGRCSGHRRCYAETKVCYSPKKNLFPK